MILFVKVFKHLVSDSIYIIILSMCLKEKKKTAKKKQK